jgi:tRNA (guanine-N7-)-methyltransferase
MRGPGLYDDAPRVPREGPLDLCAFMGAAEVELEIGPGRGGFLYERAEVRPDRALVGLEVRRKWAKLVDDRLRSRGLGERARVFAEDVKLVLPRVVSESLSCVFLHFPDPWWKKRHAKRLVLTPETAKQLARCLAPEGELFIQTDVEERALAYEAMLAAEVELLPHGALARVESNPYGAKSPRERRAEADGLPIFRLRYRKAALG